MMKYEPEDKHGGRTDLELLMQPFNYDSADDYEPDWELLDIVAQAVSELSPQDQQALQGIFYDRHTYEELAPILGTKAKSHAWRKTNKALDNLMLKLVTNKTFMKEGYMINTWDDAAWAALMYIKEEATEQTPDRNIFNPIAIVLSEWVQSGANNPDIVQDLFVRAGTEAMHILNEREPFDTEQMLRVLVSKQHDYGHNNISMFGAVGIAVRLCDKIARVENLLKRGENAMNESLKDSYMDILGYAVIAVMVNNKTFLLELEQDGN